MRGLLGTQQSAPHVGQRPSHVWSWTAGEDESRSETQYEDSRNDVEYTWADAEEDSRKVESYEQAEEEAYNAFSEKPEP